MNMAHSIPHQWKEIRSYIQTSNCTVCKGPIGFFTLYEKCRSCKLSVHEECRLRVHDNCGLTSRHVEELLNMVISVRQDNWATTESASAFSRNGTTSQLDGEHRWNRRSWNMFTFRGRGAISSWGEVTIPANELRWNSIIGQGRFGVVYEANYFGAVAIKVLNMEHVAEERRLEAFKEDVSCYKNARQGNIVDFHGYIMEKERLGIVMALIKGPPLSVILHDDEHRVKRPDFNEAVDLANQICQGMAFLHSRFILHGDLRSTNVFVQERKVVITDFGYFNVKRLAHPPRRHGILIPNRWLCYLAPELIRTLTPELTPLPLTEQSDIYAFGSIWYELLTCTYPFASLHPHSIMWYVGNGMKSPLVDVKTCREAKTLLMQCWSFNVMERRTFDDIKQNLESMPRRSLRQNPSFRTTCKSFESTF